MVCALFVQAARVFCRYVCVLISMDSLIQFDSTVLGTSTVTLVKRPQVEEVHLCMSTQKGRILHARFVSFLGEGTV